MNKNFMYEAIKQAKTVTDDIPVGAVIVRDNKIISSACNTKEKDNKITSHAEIIAIEKAEKFLNNWRLDDCEIYITLEPCPMCAWAILQSRIKRIFFGSYDAKYGAFSEVRLDKFSDYKPEVYGGILESECDKLLEHFFKKLRKNTYK